MKKLIFLYLDARDPGLYTLIWDYHINRHYEIRRAYLKANSCQFHIEKYLYFGKVDPASQFQFKWFKIFSCWLELFTKQRCCVLSSMLSFNKKPAGRLGSNVFMVEDFCNRKKVNNRKDYAILSHVGKDFCSQHNIASKA